MEEGPDGRESYVTKIGQEVIECFACGKPFERTAVLDVDPHDMRVLGDDTVVRAAASIRCPHCGYEESRPLHPREAIRYPS
jgi:hypothetical protein